jgi:hypothetical protein
MRYGTHENFKFDLEYMTSSVADPDPVPESQIIVIGIN